MDIEVQTFAELTELKRRAENKRWWSDMMRPHDQNNLVVMIFSQMQYILLIEIIM